MTGLIGVHITVHTDPVVPLHQGQEHVRSQFHPCISKCAAQDSATVNTMNPSQVHKLLHPDISIREYRHNCVCAVYLHATEANLTDFMIQVDYFRYQRSDECSISRIRTNASIYATAVKSDTTCTLKQCFFQRQRATIESNASKALSVKVTVNAEEGIIHQDQQEATKRQNLQFSASY